MQTLIDLTVPLLTFTLLAAVGLDLTTRDFARVRHQPALVMMGLAGPVFLLPLLAIGLVWVFAPAPDVAGALFLVAACPIGGISNTYSYLARASTALSVTLTGLSCLFASVTIPLIGRIFELALPQPLQLTPPIPVLAVQLLLTLALPVGLGMWLRRVRADLAQRYQGAMQRLSFIGVTLVLILVVLDNPQAFFDGLRTTTPLAAVFIVGSAVVGWVAAATVAADPRDRFTLAAEFGTRNLGVALAIAVTLLGRVEFARFAYTYFLVELPLMLAAVVLFRRVRETARVNAVIRGSPASGTS